MSSRNLIIGAYHRGLRRIILGLTVAVYTYMLPDAVLVFEALQQNFSKDLVGKIPLLIIFMLAAAYIVWGIKIQKTLQVLMVAGVSSIIVAIIISVEQNPNKHIHIPEYVLMTWILFEAISIDYRGKGMGLLILMCASMLGIVDELLQGIHPARSYGWIDMLINFASSVIGVLTLITIRRLPGGDWSWVQNLKAFTKSWIIFLVGAAAAVWMCVILFGVAAAEFPPKQIPVLLIAGGLVFILAAIITSANHGYGLYQLDCIHQSENNDFNSSLRTAHLWIVYPVTILVAINALYIWITITNSAFR